VSLGSRLDKLSERPGAPTHGRLKHGCRRFAGAATLVDVRPLSGTPGYEQFLLAAQDPKHPEHEAVLEWYGDTFDPGEFDIAQINRRLQRIKL